MGKGSKPRPVKGKKYRKNYDGIKWDTKFEEQLKHILKPLIDELKQHRIE